MAICLLAFSMLLGWFFKGAKILNDLVSEESSNESDTKSKVDSIGLMEPNTKVATKTESEQWEAARKIYLEHTVFPNPEDVKDSMPKENLFLVRYRMKKLENVYCVKYIISDTLDNAMEEALGYEEKGWIAYSISEEGIVGTFFFDGIFGHGRQIKTT